MGPRGEYLENYRFANGCQKLNTSTKSVYVKQLSDALIIQLNIFKYSDGISKKVVSNLSIDEEILLWEIEWHCLVLFVMRENSLIAHIIHQESR